MNDAKDLKMKSGTTLVEVEKWATWREVCLFGLVTIYNTGSFFSMVVSQRKKWTHTHSD